jgi:hypothetical protein
MTVSVTSLQRLMSLGLTTEQMAGVIDVLAVELAPLETLRADIEARRSKDRLRKFRGNSSECSVEVPVQSPTPPIDITTTLVLENKIPPTPRNSRLHGTNPRSLGTNPRGSEVEPDGFSAFWDAYPKRDGGADKKGALKAFGPAVQRAGGKEPILRAAVRYAAHCREKGKVGTEFVKQARSWLNGDLWTEWTPQELPPEIASSRVYVTTGTDAMDAWDDYFKRTKGKLAPRDQRGGWWFDSEFPPSQEKAA